MSILSEVRHPIPLLMDPHLRDVSIIDSQNTENQYIAQLSQALQDIQDTRPCFFELFGNSPLLHIENILCLAREIQQPVDLVKIEALQTAWETYSHYLDTSIDPIVSTQTPFERYQEAHKQAKNMGYKDIQLNARALYFKQGFQKAYITQDPETEAAAYVRVLDTRDKLLLALQYLQPKMPITPQFLKTLDVQAVSKDPQIQLLLKKKIEAYQHAVDLHNTLVKRWGQTQPGTMRTLYEKAMQKTEQGEDFVWEGRVTALKQQIDQRDALIRESFLDLYKDYQQRAQEATENLKTQIRCIDPGLIGESRLGKSTWKICQFFTWIFYHLLRWNAGVSIYGPLLHQYHLLLSETTKKNPNTAEERNAWLKGNPQIENTFLDKAAFQTLKQTYHQKAEALFTRLDETADTVSQDIEEPSPSQQTLQNEVNIKLLKNLILLNCSEMGVDFFAKVICDYDQIENVEVTLNSVSSHTFTMHYTYPEEGAIRKTRMTLNNCNIPFFNRSYKLRIKYPKVLQFTIDSEERTVHFAPGKMLEICPLQPTRTSDIFLEKIILSEDDWIQLSLQANKSKKDHKVGLARALKSYIKPDRPVWINEDIFQSMKSTLDTWTYQTSTSSKL